MKKILFLLLLAGILSAYVPEKTYTFNAGALIKASELNQNTDDVFNAITDGLADISVKSISTNTIIATTYNYTTTKTKYTDYTVGDVLVTTTNLSAYTISGNAGYLITANRSILIPLWFPGDSTVTEINFFVPVGEAKITANLYQMSTQNVRTSISSTMYSNGTSYGIGHMPGTGTLGLVIDNTNYAYYVEVGASAPAYWYALQTAYTITSLSTEGR